MHSSYKSNPNMKNNTPANAPFEVVIQDQEFIQKATRLAAHSGRKDVKAFIEERVLLAARQAVGLGRDLSVNEVAGQLGCHVNTVWNYHRARKFPHSYHLADRRLRIPQQDVDALKESTAKEAVGQLPTGPKTEKRVMYPIAKMQISDAFCVPSEKLRNAQTVISHHRKQWPHKEFSARPQGDGSHIIERTA